MSDASATKHKVLVIAYRPLGREPRALRQVAALRDEYEVTTAAVGDTPIQGVRHIELPAQAQRGGALGRLAYLALLALRVYAPITRLSAQDTAVRHLLGDGEWDVVVAHDVLTIRAALALSARRGVVADLHEFAPRQGDDSFAWRLLIAPYFRWLCRTAVPQAAAVTTVSQGIVDAYRREYGIDSVLTINATSFQDLRPTAVGNPLRLVHSGVAAPPRRLDILIDAVLRTSADVTLDFYLAGSDSRYAAGLRARAGQSDRIRFHDPVPYAALIPTLNAHDVGVHVLPAANFNHRWALPNKMFDYVQARLGVLVGPSPEMARVVAEAGFGAVTDDFTAESLATALEKLSTDQVTAWKQASHAAAHVLSGERQMDVFRGLVAGVLANPDS